MTDYVVPILLFFACSVALRKKENAYVIFRLEDNEKAAEVLTAKGIKMASSEEIYLL